MTDKHVHLIGIGGIGMSAIAHLLLKQGVRVSGSDVKSSRITEELKKTGATIFIGQDPANCRRPSVHVPSASR
ncbi:MAG: Mur ligase domain-containing protein [Candidatus Omnitrophica bacterium]|nr:Mur ligase domain-containing protein [Candidatus Omnitrophota bacterium]